MKGNARVVHADDAEGEPEEDDEDVPAHGVPRHEVSPQVQVKDAGPHERKETASEVSNEAHENGEVGDEHGEHDGQDDNPDSVAETPDLELSVQGPDRGKLGVRFASEQFVLN